MFDDKDVSSSTDAAGAGGKVRWLPVRRGKQRERAIARWEDEGGRIANSNVEADAPALPEKKLRRLKALLVRLRALEVAVRIEAQAARPDDDHLQRLKRARVRVRDEIHALQRA